MLYWTGHLPTTEEAIELRRRNLRDELVALECLTELLPLLQALPEVGDHATVDILSCGWEEMQKQVPRLISAHWSEDPEGRAVLRCLNKYQRKRTIDIRCKPVLCATTDLHKFDDD